ncbi:MAG TPA: DUF4893 domain-containing protein, partial [Sphingomonas sp.]
RARLRELRAAWMRGLATLPAAVRRDALFDPDRALPDVTPPYGTYRCRLHRLGGTPPAAEWQPCRIERDKTRQRFVVEGGGQRPAGHLYPDTGQRMVFLGSLVIGRERRVLPYGRDRLRDLGGVVERVGPARWRLVIPAPRFGDAIDVMELVPG